MKTKSASGKKIFAVILITLLFLCGVAMLWFMRQNTKEYRIRITIPAGETEGFCYSDEEIRPKGNTLVLAAGEGLGDCEIVLDPVEVRQERAYESTYMTPGVPVKMDVYVTVKNVEIRIE